MSQTADVFAGLRSYFAESPVIGIFSPVFFANAIASGYPASACRATPSPGSFVSTRSIRLAISFVPSATVTCPACNE